MIEVPFDVMSFRTCVAFVPLNSTEVAILGGQRQCRLFLGGVFTFNTNTNEFKREVEEEGALNFACSSDRSAQVHENTIVAVAYATVDLQSKGYYIKYTKGDTGVTRLTF